MKTDSGRALSFPAKRSFNLGTYLDDYIDVLRGLDRSSIELIARHLLDAWRANRIVFCCGNGGSSSSASHFVMDLTKLSSPPHGRRVRTMALTESIAAISAISNDIAYEEIFVEQMKPFLEPKDVVIGFSTSGSSPNVLRATEFGNTNGAITIGVTGKAGQRLRDLAQLTLTIDSTSVQHVEDATMVVGHLVCLRVKGLIALEDARDLLGGSGEAAFGLPASVVR